ncbi:MAG: metallophosphoesterase family protein [Bacteroidales bacterium]|nr:metallophosphoesterase family protein [Bacteroidales bacterium]
MIKIGLLSDTHGSIPDRAVSFFAECDELWHAGDIGNYSVVEKLRKIKPLKAVYGNIDGGILRQEFPEVALFEVEGLRVLMMHIGGYPGRYTQQARPLIEKYRPGLFISGHSHILKVIFDKKHQLLHINPGAAGNSGFHKNITMVRFQIEKGRISDLEVFDKERNREI